MACLAPKASSGVWGVVDALTCSFSPHAGSAEPAPPPPQMMHHPLIKMTPAVIEELGIVETVAPPSFSTRPPAPPECRGESGDGGGMPLKPDPAAKAAPSEAVLPPPRPEPGVETAQGEVDLLMLLAQAAPAARDVRAVAGGPPGDKATNVGSGQLGKDRQHSDKPGCAQTL